MKKMTSMVALMGIGLMVGGTGIDALGTTGLTGTDATAQAATLEGKYSRIDKDAMNSRYQYKVLNKKGKVYSISGTKKNAKLKTIHYLKNYKTKKWTRTKITQVKHNGNWMVYYYMKSNAKNKAAGWVKLTDMQVTSPKPGKATKHEAADFDTWYKDLSKTQRGYYKIAAESGPFALNYKGEQVPLQNLSY
ncbi:MAG TPA: hypothetical protein H9875_04545 [Candidatus Levilactobacillus faecigallinarum]|uniref:Surface layer protein A domain-containing protein n=1 Tax=Candidatus Levilactobacillus faecigallinarum TaxID=2838638 RepID=A0A9D1U4G8_9LACO|nr:hypothetical protein [Candidatus Levilactobacillus faecigallinarum]